MYAYHRLYVCPSDQFEMQVLLCVYCNCLLLLLKARLVCLLVTLHNAYTYT